MSNREIFAPCLCCCLPISCLDKSCTSLVPSPLATSFYARMCQHPFQSTHLPMLWTTMHLWLLCVRVNIRRLSHTVSAVVVAIPIGRSFAAPGCVCCCNASSPLRITPRISSNSISGPSSSGDFPSVVPLHYATKAIARRRSFAPAKVIAVRASSRMSTPPGSAGTTVKFTFLLLIHMSQSCEVVVTPPYRSIPGSRAKLHIQFVCCRLGDVAAIPHDL
jgi:hypothetical protein